MGAFRGIVAGVCGALSLASLCSLSACDPPPQQQQASVTKPPPKPPHCPHSPELKNITLPDGTIADVRIFDDEGQVFYVPFSWYRWELDHYNSNDPYHSLGRYDPEVDSGECPGVIHRGNFSYATPLADFGRGDIPPNVARDSALYAVTFFKAGQRSKFVINGVQEHLQGLGIAYEAFIHVGHHYYARYTIYPGGAPNREVGPEWERFRTKVMTSADWRQERHEVRELFNWLQTPPRARDNGRIFQLGRRPLALHRMAAFHPLQT